MRKRNSTKDMVATIIGLWKADLPWADEESSFSPECRRSMRSTPGQAPPMPTEHYSLALCVRGQQGGAECN